MFSLLSVSFRRETTHLEIAKEKGKTVGNSTHLHMTDAEWRQSFERMGEITLPEQTQPIRGRIAPEHVGGIFPELCKVEGVFFIHLLPAEYWNVLVIVASEGIKSFEEWLVEHLQSEDALCFHIQGIDDPDRIGNGTMCLSLPEPQNEQVPPPPPCSDRLRVTFCECPADPIDG